jgi:hypothetical protein
MQDRFEKEVQRKMEELRLTPSAPVWEKIEMEIKVEKKRRRVFFWLFFAGLLLAGGTWWLSNSLSENAEQLHSRNTENQTINNSQTQQPGNTIVNSKENTTKQESESVPNNISKQLPAIKTNDAKRDYYNNSNGDNNSIAKLTQKTPVVKTGNPFSKNRKKSEENNEIAKTQEVVSTETKVETKENSNTQATLPVTKPNTINDVVSKEVPLSEIVVKDSLVQPPSIQQSIPKQPAVDSSLKKKIASNKKWNKQINVMAGVSNFTSGLSLLKSSSRQDANFAAIGSGTSGVVSNNNRPSEISAGFSFSLGFSLSKKLNEHWETSFGLQYTHLSTSMEVGEKRRVDTGTTVSADGSKVNEFFTNTSTANYTNRFHILELPVIISYKPSVKLPLYISAGISYGRLISTNALTFSSTSNVYYKNSENNSQNLLPAQLSAQYRFGSKSKLSVQTGPFVQYNLLEFQKESTDGKSHTLFAGLKTTVNF